jgi:acyl-CoA dehydrogenase
MDVLGGKGICLGPSNFLGRAYQQVPVGITVEGANILTRSLIIFGQGAIRCHPYVLKEMEAARRAKGLRLRQGAVGPHRHTLATASAPGAWASPARTSSAPPERGARNPPLLPAADALLGGLRLPRRRLHAGHGRRPQAQGEALRALGDILSLMYLASATLKRYEAEGRQAADAPLMHWAIWDACSRRRTPSRA